MVDPEWKDLWRNTCTSVLPGYHQNRLVGDVPEEVLRQRIAESNGPVPGRKEKF